MFEANDLLSKAKLKIQPNIQNWLDVAYHVAGDETK